MLQGSLVAIVTPMHSNGSLDEPALRKLVDYHIAQGSDGIIAVGTTGESPTLDYDEHIEVIRIVVEQSAGRVPVIGGTGSNSTAEAIELTRAAKSVGANACLLVVPYYNKPTQEGMYRHFKAIAEAVDIPQILYNVPGRTGCDMSPETVGRLASLPNIVGLKDATGDLSRVKKHLGLCGEQFALYSGDDATSLEYLLLGGHGVISVTANVAPRAMHELCELALAGKRAEAEALNAKLMGLHKGLFLEPNPIPVKWAVNQMGLIEDGIRLPLLPLSEIHHETIRQAMRQAGI
jgi:4-hydroxy-tetrahydrodipicolinate synthase